jgi:hypothetical protein
MPHQRLPLRVTPMRALGTKLLRSGARGMEFLHHLRSCDESPGEFFEFRGEKKNEAQQRS